MAPEAPDNEDADETVVNTSGRRGLLALVRRRWVVPIVLAVVLVGLLGTSAVLWLGARESLDDAPIVTATARQAGLNFFSLDYRRADADIDRVLDMAADPFKAEYAKAREQVKKGLRDKKLVVTATVPDSGAALEYLRGDRAQVLVAVDTKTTVAGKKSDDQRHRARIELTEVDGTWLVSGVYQVG